MDENCRPAALIFDVDGTLYRQRPIRMRMFQRLAARTLVRPGEMMRVWRALAAYRSAQEKLRITCPDCASISDAQIQMACRSTGLPQDVVTRYIAEWIESAPLEFLAAAMHDGVIDLLRVAKQNGVRLAVWSDYPAQEKLKAMRLTAYFDVVVCAQDDDVRRLKPDPRGLQLILERLRVSKDDAIYIGDRPEIDGDAAARAGVRCFIVGKPPVLAGPSNWNFVSGYRELMKTLALTDQPPNGHGH